jgi:DNA-binding NtrC family response regulator
MAQLKKVLLIDDDEDLREALSEQLLMTEDFDVYEGSSGAELWKRLSNKVMTSWCWMWVCQIQMGVSCAA